MNPRETSPEEMLDQLIGEIRDERVDDAQVEESGRRVWDRIQQKSAGSGRLASCNDFQALIPSYREGTLAPGRRMLLEDHAHQCVVCRKVLFGETEAPAQSYRDACPSDDTSPMDGDRRIGDSGIDCGSLGI